jgi:MFS family permease
MVLSLFFFGAGASGLNCAFLDISPRFSSTINTIGNTVGAIAGLLGPILVSGLTTAIEGKWGWRLVFILTAGLGVISIIVWSIFQTSDIIPVLNTPVNESLHSEYDDDESESKLERGPSSHRKL